MNAVQVSRLEQLTARLERCAVHRGVVGSISEAQVLKLEELANRLASLLGGESTSPVPSTEPLPSPQPPGPSKPEEGKEKSKAKVQRLDKFDFSYPPHPDFFNVQYENVVACRPSGAGSQGVIFAETDEPKGIIVVKGSAQPAGEIFATKVVRWVGLIAPEILLLRRKEHPQIEDAVKRFDPALVGKINKAYIQQLEFLPGVTLTDFEESSVMKDNFSKWMAEDEKSYIQPNTPLRELLPRAGKTSRTGPGTSLMCMIGKLCAVDVFLNYTDRLPLVTDNSGNPGNVMLSKTEGKLLSLDNGIMSIVPRYIHQHVKRIDKVLGQAKTAADKGIVIPSVLTVLEMMQAHVCGYSFTAMDGAELQAGFILGCWLCANQNVVSMPAMMAERKKLASLSFPLNDLSSIEESYLEAMQLLFAAHFEHVNESSKFADLYAVNGTVIPTELLAMALANCKDRSKAKSFSLIRVPSCHSVLSAVLFLQRFFRWKWNKKNNLSTRGHTLDNAVADMFVRSIIVHEMGIQAKKASLDWKEEEPPSSPPTPASAPIPASASSATKVYPLSVLVSVNLPVDVKVKEKHLYLSDEEFGQVFKMNKDQFVLMPKWKQDGLKKNAKLF